MRTLPVGLAILLSVSCAGTPVSQEAQRLVPLIKAQRFDELTDPDHLAEAFVEALREMKAEGADAKRIVRVADFFFEHYPFSIKDIAIDEKQLEAVVRMRGDAAMTLAPETEGCRKLKGAATLKEAETLLASWGGPHEDGDRCGLAVIQLIDRTAGKSAPDHERVESLKDLCVAATVPLSRSGFLPLIAFRTVKAVDAWREHWVSWNSMREGIHITDRWSRLFYSRLSRLGALHQPVYCEGWIEAGKSWETSRFDSRLRDLGRAVVELATYADNTTSQDFKKVPEAATRVMAAGRGTPFADAARFEWIRADFEVRYPDVTDDLLLRLAPEFEHPFFISVALIERAAHYLWLGEAPRAPERGVALLKGALDLRPPPVVAARAISLMADVDRDAGREAEMVARLESILRISDDPASEYEPELSLADLQSDARRTLARHFQKHEAWSRALQIWKEFEPAGWCGNDLWGQEAEREIGMAVCLERLNRLDEAVGCYWRAVGVPDDDGEKAAQRLKEIYKGRNAADEFRRRGLDLVHRATEDGGSIQHVPGLKWLAEDLGVPVK